MQRTADAAVRMGAAGLAVAALSLVAVQGKAAEPPECLSSDPKDWPAPARPYFIIAFDTSTSMTTAVASNNSCGYPNDRLGHGRCAVQKTVMAFGGQASFGLATFARKMENCSATCFSGCTYANFPGNYDKNCKNGCGPEPDPAQTYSPTRAGANIVVPVVSDLTVPYPPGGNTAELLGWVDDDCTGSKELFADGCTPVNGILRDMYRYYSSAWTVPGGGTTHASPLKAPAQGERACRSVNVILVSDGGESCDTDASAKDAAADLLAGFTKDGITWSVKTYVIDFGETGPLADVVALAGGTGKAQSATDEVSLSTALANVIAAAMAPEVCDNADNNCNGCTDEGYKHYCNVGQTCCSWSDQAGRQACVDGYLASIPGSPPDGDLTKLPCTSALQQADPKAWLCYNPGDVCDEADNNCSDGADEGQLKCGNPAHCPKAESCNGQDDDCDGQIDENVCQGCVPSPEVCDGCDNDCDGVADNPPQNGFPPLPCGLLSPPNCAGTIACLPPQNVPVGTCAQAGGYGSCTNSPQAEQCDGVDNDCDGSVDDGYVPSACEPPQNPPNLVYSDSFPASQCQKGVKQCKGGSEICVGGSGASAEVCDGIDNDCDGVVDDSPAGVNQPCGINTPPCTLGKTACVNGALSCQGGNQPQAEQCDGVDNDCDGSIDEPPLSDAPKPGKTGCWSLPGNCCSHQGLSWCPPAGASCDGVGMLGAPCNVGTLACNGKNGWTCLGDAPPSAEVCDGIDNDCDGQTDDGMLPNVGDKCGSNVGECQEGALACSKGLLDCAGDVPPSQEQCDGKDNDCNGVIDDGIPAMGACTMAYDGKLFPGDRSSLPCQPGVLQCDGMGGLSCTGGVAPAPEVCDGVDNDCDGVIDEPGAAPDGIDGTDNPLPPPAAKLGDACGQSQGQCKAGVFACVNGLFNCIGGEGPTLEECDCRDNDCDGTSDELPEPGKPALCSPGKDCVQAPAHCQCAAPCGTGEYPCPPGQECVTVKVGGKEANYCVVDFEVACGDCALKTAKDGMGNVVCAPPGSDEPGCVLTPACQCKLQNGCREPCFDVACPEGKVCSSFGPAPGTCVDDICYQTGCPGCFRGCHDGACVDSPCSFDSCAPHQVARPSADWTACECVESCAGVACGAGKICEDGACVTGCDPPCAEGEVCIDGSCAASACTDESCPDGSYCDPETGVCGDYPCEGVLCPEGQTCADGSCFDDSVGGGGGAVAEGGGGAGGSPRQPTYGLPTGGGGCTCDMGRRDTRHWWPAFLLLGALARRRRFRA